MSIQHRHELDADIDTRSVEVLPAELYRQHCRSLTEQQHGRFKKRPPEPVIPLDHAAIRIAELNALIEQGRAEADADAVRAGFFGGDSNMSLVLWISIGFLMMGICVALVSIRISIKHCNHTITEPPVDIFSLCILDGTIIGFTTFWSQPSLVLIALCTFLRAYFMHHHSHLNAYRAMVGFCWATVSGFATIGITCAKFWHTDFGDIASIITMFIAAVGLGAVGVLLTWRRTVAAQHYGVSLIMLVPFACSCAAINVGLKPFHHWGPAAAGKVDTFVVHVLYVVFLAFSGLTGLLSAIFFMHVRKRQLRDADELIAGDKTNYDMTWAHILASHSGITQVITSLASVVKSWRSEYDIFKTGETPQNRPVNRKLTDATLKTMLRVSRMGTISSKPTGRPRQQVADVCVLFAQAGALNDHFQGLVLKWAAGLSGAIVHSSPVKRRARAIEKLHRAYHSDPGWIIDLVRASITFDTLDALLWCIQRLIDDSTVAILQIKNRFDPGYDSSLSAGYRNLSISFVVVDEVTMGLKVEHHICELQLGLSAIDAFKNDAGHDKYVKWRNMRAE